MLPSKSAHFGETGLAAKPFLLVLHYMDRSWVEHTLQQVGQSLGPEGDRPLGFVVGDGELLHAQLLRHFGLRAVVHQRTAEQLHAQKASHSHVRNTNKKINPRME